MYMIEVLYKTSSPQIEKSECYVLVLAHRAGSDRGFYAFMEKHGLWDEGLGRFLHHVTFINAEQDLTHQAALAMYHKAKLRLEQKGFVHSVVLDIQGKYPQPHRSSHAELTAA
jgi:hypothetical protein